MRIPGKALFRQLRSYIQRTVDKLTGIGLDTPLDRKKVAPRPIAAPSRIAAHADERTLRRMAEAERGGLSSKESAARYARGENPGGTHRRAVRHDGPDHLRPNLYEPQERKETVPGGARHIAVMRRGA